MSQKLHAALSSLSHAGYLSTTENILSNLNNHPLVADPIPPPFPNLDQLKAVTDSYRDLYHAAQNGDRVKIAQRNMVRADSQTKFISLANYLENKAGSNTYLLLDIGFDLRDRAARGTQVGTSTVEAANVVVKHGEVTGVVLLKCARVNGAGSYEVQMMEGEASADGNWQNAGSFLHCSRMEIKGLEPGKRYSFRVRVLGANGFGPWSASVSIICL